MNNEENKVQETPVVEEPDTSAEDLEKKLAEAKAKRDELLRAKIAKLEAEAKELEEDKEMAQYTFPVTKAPQTIQTAEPVGTTYDNIKKLFEAQAGLLEIFPDIKDRQQRSVLPKEMQLPNGMSIHEAFRRYYFNKEPLEKILE